MNQYPYLIEGNLLWPDGRIAPGILTAAGPKIHSLEAPEEKQEGNGSERASENRRIIHVPPGGVAAPGFIDLQINGAFGHDFTTQPWQMTAVARHLPRFGVTAFLPTLVTAPLERYVAATDMAREVVRSPESAALIGLHFKGPYLNPAKAGAHPVHYLRRPAADEISYFDPDFVRLVTLAPELPGALSFIKALVDLGIRVGIGHSVASYEQALAAVEAGASWGPHLFNAMAGLHHRHPGITGALLSDERLRLGLIADTVHVHPAILRMVAAAKGVHHVTLISDAMAAAGMPDGEHHLGEQKVIVNGNSVRLANGSLAGSRFMLDQGVRQMVETAKRPLAEVLQMASATPALVAGVENKGKLAAGYDADIVILDQKLQVALTMIQGEVVYRAK